MIKEWIAFALLLLAVTAVLRGPMGLSFWPAQFILTPTALLFAWLLGLFGTKWH